MITPTPTEIDRQRISQHGLEAYRKLANNRHYACDDQTVLALGALSAAYAEQGKAAGNKSFNPVDLLNKVFEPLSKYVPSLVQDRPAAEAPTPQPWKDETTGEVAKNPYQNPKDFRSIALLEKLDPLLAEHLKTMAEGVSYAKLQELKEAKRQREMLRAIEYDHSKNPWVTGDLSTQSQFVQQHDPAIVAFYKQEAQPVELNFDNLTLKGQLAQHDPPLRELWQRAHEIYASWQNEDRAQLEQERAAVEQKLQAHRSKQSALA